MSLPDYSERFPSLDSPFLQKPVDLVNTTYNLYGFLPPDDDIRWGFLSRYHDTRTQVGFRALNFANATRATYLSDTPSFQTGFVNSTSPENMLQLDRALDNLSHQPKVSTWYDASTEGFGDFDLTLTTTDRLTSAPEDTTEITPCPEALYQIRLSHAGRYLARAGFNLHHENDGTVLSFVNLQGAKESIDRNEAFQTTFEISPFNLVARRVLALAGAGDSDIEVRGIRNPAKGNSKLYWCVFSGEQIVKWRAHHKEAAVLAEDNS